MSTDEHKPVTADDVADDNPRVLANLLRASTRATDALRECVQTLTNEVRALQQERRTERAELSRAFVEIHHEAKRIDELTKRVADIEAVLIQPAPRP